MELAPLLNIFLHIMIVYFGLNTTHKFTTPRFSYYVDVLIKKNTDCVKTGYLLPGLWLMFNKNYISSVTNPQKGTT